jgi:hypothetical protein
MYYRNTKTGWPYTVRPIEIQGYHFSTLKGLVSDPLDLIDKIYNRQTSTRVGDHRGIPGVVRFAFLFPAPP